MKKPELNTVELSDRIATARRKVTLAKLAIGGIGRLNDESDTGPVEELLYEVIDELNEISEDVHPPSAIGLQAEKMRQITEDRIASKVRAETERQAEKDA